MKITPQIISKLEAAQRQLREAVYLFFEQRDFVAIHTLAAAALQIYADVAKHCGAASILKHGLYVREEKKKEWFGIMNEAQNFFKHADTDPNGTLHFKAAATPFYILDAVLLQSQLLGKLTPSGSCFLVWFYAAHPDVLTDEPYKAFVQATVASGVSPQDFPLFLDLLRCSEAKEHTAQQVA